MAVCVTCDSIEKGTPALDPRGDHSAACCADRSPVTPFLHFLKEISLRGVQRRPRERPSVKSALHDYDFGARGAGSRISATVLALIFARVFYLSMLKSDEGDENMQRVSGYVREGALAYLKQQYKVVGAFFVVVSALLFYMGWVLHVQHQIVFLAFLTGGFFSGLCGWLGMNTATRASHRTAAGARKSLNDGLVVAGTAGSGAVPSTGVAVAVADSDGMAESLAMVDVRVW